MQTKTDTQWLTMAGVMEHLSASRNTVKRLMREEGLPHHRLGPEYRFDRDEVDAWLRSSRCSSPAPDQAGSAA